LAPPCPGWCEIIVVIGNPDLAGDVDQSASPTVEFTRKRPACRSLVAVQLQTVIDEHTGAFRLMSALWIPSRATSAPRRYKTRHRLGDGMVQLDVEIEDGAVGRLPGIVLGQGLRILGGATRQPDRRQSVGLGKEEASSYQYIG